MATATQWRKASVNGTHFDDPMVREDLGSPDDARALWIDGQENVLLFHVTTEERGASIIANGPTANVCRVGWHGVQLPEAFWCGAIPLHVHYEAWMPHLDNKAVSVLGVVAAWSVARQRIFQGNNWPCVQYALQPSDVLASFIVEDWTQWRSRYAVEQITNGLGHLTMGAYRHE